MNDRLQTSLTQLHLSGLARSLDVRLQEAAGHQLSHAEFLELVLQDELLVRQQRQIERRTNLSVGAQSASFREVKTLDHFDWSFNPSVPRKQNVGYFITAQTPVVTCVLWNVWSW